MPEDTAEATQARTVPVAPKPAATVMLVRDGARGVEVFLMERSAFGMFGGLHVFPGGKVDAADRAHDWAKHVRGLDETAARVRLGLGKGGLGHWIACIRECFEEAGVLLATGADGRLLTLHDPERRRRFADWRRRLNAGTAEVFRAMCRAEALTLATDRLAYVSHWITPVGQPSRYDTRFFVAAAPLGQDALHDGFEAVESAWIRPERALERHARGELNLISPTLANLRILAGHETTDALLAARRRVDPATIPTILPRITPREDGGYDEIEEVVGRGGRPFASADGSGDEREWPEDRPSETD